MRKIYCVALLYSFFIACSDDLKGVQGDAGLNINARKPMYEQLDAGTTKVNIPATATQPAKVGILGTAYINTETVVCDLSQNGRNGLDILTLVKGKIYYLYAVPSSSGTTFDSVASLSNPNTGPYGFDNWSYIGAFRVDIEGTVAPFVHTGEGIEYVSRSRIVETDDIFTAYTHIAINAEAIISGDGELVPNTARTVFLSAYFGAVNSSGTSINRGAFEFSVDGTNLFSEVAGWPDVPNLSGSQATGDVSMPISTDLSFYYKITGPSEGDTRSIFRIYVRGFEDYPEYWP